MNEDILKLLCSGYDVRIEADTRSDHLVITVSENSFYPPPRNHIRMRLHFHDISRSKDINLVDETVLKMLAAMDHIRHGEDM